MKSFPVHVPDTNICESEALTNSTVSMGSHIGLSLWRCNRDTTGYKRLWVLAN